MILAHSKEVPEQTTNPKPVAEKDSLKIDSARSIRPVEVFDRADDRSRIPPLHGRKESDMPPKREIVHSPVRLK